MPIARKLTVEPELKWLHFTSLRNKLIHAFKIKINILLTTNNIENSCVQCDSMWPLMQTRFYQKYGFTNSDSVWLIYLLFTSLFTISKPSILCPPHLQWIRPFQAKWHKCTIPCRLSECTYTHTYNANFGPKVSHHTRQCVCLPQYTQRTDTSQSDLFQVKV